MQNLANNSYQVTSYSHKLHASKINNVPLDAR